MKDKTFDFVQKYKLANSFEIYYSSQKSSSESRAILDHQFKLQ